MSVSIILKRYYSLTNVKVAPLQMQHKHTITHCALHKVAEFSSSNIPVFPVELNTHVAQGYMTLYKQFQTRFIKTPWLFLTVGDTLSASDSSVSCVVFTWRLAQLQVWKWTESLHVK